MSEREEGGDEGKALQIVTFDQAKRLKAAGFGWKTHDYYMRPKFKKEWMIQESMFLDDYNRDDENHHPRISAPAVALALRWARDVKGILDFTFEDFRLSLSLRGAVVSSPNVKSEISNLKYELAESALLDAVLDEIEREWK